MAMRARRQSVRRPVKDAEAEDLDLEDVEDVEDLEDLDDAEEAEEEDEPKPARRSRRLAAAAEEPAPAKVAPAKAKKPQPVVEVVEAEEADEEDTPAPTAKIRKVDSVVAENVLTGVLQAMEQGQSVVFTRLAENKWQLASAQSVISPAKKRGKEFWAEVRSPEYDKWKVEWKTKTFDEKKKYATKIGATWEPHQNPQIEIMRITAAVREKLGIEKYKPEYASRSARAALRG